MIGPRGDLGPAVAVAVQQCAAGAAVAVILGDDELAGGVATLRNLVTGEQSEVPLGQLTDQVRALLAQLGRGELAGWTLYAPTS